MIIYRVGRTKWANDISGEGARLFGGRWNRAGTACLYASASRALSVLEYTVNVGIDDIPRSLSITTYDLMDLNILELDQEALPGDWKASPSPSSTKDFGTALLQDPATAVIKIASSVIPEEFNYLINPLNENMSKIQIVDVRDFVYDVRIKG
jgi:RES domain-containing protein